MIVAMLRYYFRPGVDIEEYQRLGTEMSEVINKIPGYLADKDFSAPDGEQVSVVQFASLEAFYLWRDNYRHITIKRRGREEFFYSYHITVSSVIDTYSSAVPQFEQKAVPPPEDNSKEQSTIGGD
ncbi:MAG: antibiotic biosynthesis monooxygenase [Pyrinomonadaceae bacterium]|nr:antibiotic biosynthesis monooxygenase [Pyrinomonadaceae bacterium]